MNFSKKSVVKMDYFTELLIKYTEGTYLKYRKSTLNKVYLHEKNKKYILESIKEIEFKTRESSNSGLFS